MKITFIAVLTLAAIALAGCTKDSSSPMTETLPMPNFTTSPADGQANVRLDAAVTLTFAKPVDRAVVERSFHLISQRDMADSLCPVSDTMGHGMMTAAMMDSMNMNHIMQRHATRGRFVWSSDAQCTFRPDSMMTPRMQYMMHIGSEMMRMMRDRMEGMNGGMGGHGTSFGGDEMAFHFSTLDTTGGGLGHNGHH
ncbi:MAG: hypothetical protein HY961_14555 [Ignavibacteriae bacterium]|nr:hypothetical protein [Ignavibacteriota bacterium]